MMVLRNIGILVSYIMGATIDYYAIPCISIVFPVIFLVIFLMFPNTPQYHLQRNQTQVSHSKNELDHTFFSKSEPFTLFDFQKAESALKFYKGYKGNSKQEDEALSNEFERLKIIVNDRQSEEKVKLSDFSKLITHS